MAPRLGPRTNYTFYRGQAPVLEFIIQHLAAVLRSRECFVFGEIKVTVLLVVLSLWAPALTHSTRNKTLGHVHQILSSF